MPSRRHELLVEMFRDRPALAADMLAGRLGVAVPAFDKAWLSSGELTDVKPTEYRADAVVTLKAGDDPVFAVVVEVQLRIDARKRRTWPVYVATVHARLGCPVMLLVVCPDEAVAAWCAKPVSIGDSDLTLIPRVVGPQQLPVVTDVDVARGDPELTVLSALAHAGRVKDPLPLFEAMIVALDVVDHDHAGLYTELVSEALPAATRAWLEEFMIAAASRHESKFLRRLMERGKAEGIAEGKVEGKVEGTADGKASALLSVLDVRHIHVPDDVRADITACTDMAQLDMWIRRAVTADKIQDVVD
jgi:hypothetical protein